MKPHRESLFPNDLSDETATVLSEFLHSLTAQCDARYFIQVRRFYASQEVPFDPLRPWITKPPDR